LHDARIYNKKTVGGEKSRKKFGGRSGKSVAWNEKKSDEQEK
jgi:hypothetical protein